MPQIETLLRKLKKHIECLEFALNHEKFFISNEIDFIINSIDFDSESLLIELNRSGRRESDEDEEDEDAPVAKQEDLDRVNQMRERMIDKLREYKDEFLNYHQEAENTNDAYAFRMDLMRRQEKYSVEFDALRKRMSRFGTFEELDTVDKECYENLYKQVDKELYNLKKHYFRSNTIIYLSSPIKSTIGSLLIIENLFLDDFERELCKK